MSNRSYCRFQNTLKDLEDCAEHITDVLTADEHVAREAMLKHCRHIVAAEDTGSIPDAPSDEGSGE